MSPESKPSYGQEELLSEDEFLEKLQLYMKNRGTPIERIPYLGFKQINLFLLYKTVRDFGGFNEVTANQQWKQVYNLLGGDHRSTSAATCTRRHYQRLILPFECHLKGREITDVIPPGQESSQEHIRRKNRLTGDRRKSTKKQTVNFQAISPQGNQMHTCNQNLQLPLPFHQYFYPGLPIMPSMLQIPPHDEGQQNASCHHQHMSQLLTQESGMRHAQWLRREEALKRVCEEPLDLSRKDGISDTKIRCPSSLSLLPPQVPNKASIMYPNWGLAQADHYKEEEKGGVSLTSSVTSPLRVHEKADVHFSSDATSVSDRSVSVSPSGLSCSPPPLSNSSSNSVDVMVTKTPESNSIVQSEEEETLNFQQTLKFKPLTNPQGQMMIEIPFDLLKKLVKCTFQLEQQNYHGRGKDAWSNGSPTAAVWDNKDLHRTDNKHPMANDLSRWNYMIQQMHQYDGYVTTPNDKQQRRENVLDRAGVVRLQQAYGAANGRDSSACTFSQYSKPSIIGDCLKDDSFNKIQPASPRFGPAPYFSDNSAGRDSLSGLGPLISANRTSHFRLGQTVALQTGVEKMVMGKHYLHPYGQEACIRRPIPTAP